MPYCRNCGKEINSPFCPYCGTKAEEVETYTNQNSNTNFDMFGMLNQMNELIKSATVAENEGRNYLNGNEMQIIKNLTDYSTQIINQSDKMSIQFKEEQAKKREARRAIASGHCPECGAKIGKHDDFCPKCGADCLMEAYSDI